MARKEYMADEPSIFTLNETSVGAGGNNRKRTDVQLVQFFLRQFYKRHPELFKLLPKTSAGDGTIKIDGVCGGQTSKGIYYFQKHMKSAGVSIMVDGKVDVALGTSSSISNTIYTVHHLNGWFQKWADATGNVEKHPDCIKFAPELQAELCARGIDDAI